MLTRFVPTRALIASALLPLAAIALPQTAMAEEVLLFSHDGSAVIAGDLLGYADGRYSLETALGVQLVPSRLVQCTGAACPAQDLIRKDVLAAGDLPIGEMPIEKDGVVGNFCPITGQPLG